jgi:hypothetical protein
MTCPEIEEAVLKVDARGRIRITPEQRARILEEYERSGVSARKFAKMAGDFRIRMAVDGGAKEETAHHRQQRKRQREVESENALNTANKPRPRLTVQYKQIE